MALGDSSDNSGGGGSKLDFLGNLLGTVGAITFQGIGMGQQKAGYAQQQAGLATEQQGLGIEQAGSAQTISGATAFNAAQQQQILLEQSVEEQRRRSMEILAGRAQLETTRNVQKAASAVRSAAATSGALFTSAAKAGQQGAVQKGAYEIEGTQQQLDIGRATFALNQQISNQKIAQAQADLTMKQGQFQMQQGQFQVQAGGYQVQAGQLAVNAGKATSQFGSQLGSAAANIGKLASLAVLL